MPELVQSFATWLESCGFATAIAESAWAFPIIETVHVFALCLVVGSISMIDLRLLGVSRRHRPVRELIGSVLPWTWGAFTIAALAGLLLFSSKASQYLVNPFFRLKIVLLAFAALNMLIFHFITARTIANWDQGAPPVAARAAGAVSLVLWMAVVAAGRWMGFADV